MLFRLLPWFMAAFVCLFTLQPADAQNLSSPLSGAAPYNLFTFGNLTMSNSDSEGRIAVGGNASFTNYSVATGFVSNPSSAGNSLMVRGNIGYNQGEVKFGNVRYGGTLSGTMSVPNGTITKGTTLDFNSIKNDLLVNSDHLALTAPNGTVTNNAGDLKLLGTKSGVNVFSVSGADLNGAWRVSVDAPAGSTVLVNVNGLTDDFDNLDFRFTDTNGAGSTTASRTLFNFHQATTLSISSIGIGGTVLAPRAAVSFNWSQINGQLIADSVSGTGEVHIDPFSGTFTSLATVPEPSVLGAFVCGCIPLIFRRRK